MNTTLHAADQVSVVLQHRLSPVLREELEDALDQAMHDHFLKGDDGVVNNHQSRLAVVYQATGKVIGFLTPQKTSYKGERYWRPGALYLLPEYRGKGIMRYVLQDYLSTHNPAMAWIDDHNHRSIRLFKSLGFVQDKPYRHENAPGHWYILSKANVGLEELAQSQPYSW